MSQSKNSQLYQLDTSLFNLLINPKREDVDVPKLDKMAFNYIRSEKNRKPDPQGNHAYAQETFLEFQSSKGLFIKLRLFIQKTSQSPKAVVLINHGYGSHSNKFAHFASYFADNGIDTIGIDFRGFGKSEGQLRGYIESFDDLLQDNMYALEYINENYSQDLPRFFLGQSMGGLTGYHLGLEFPKYFNGFVFLSPALHDQKYEWVGKKFMHYLSYFLPTIETIRPGKIACSKNPNCDKAFEKDNCNYNGGHRPKTVDSIISEMDKAHLKMHLFNENFIIIQSGLDTAISIYGALNLMEKSPSQDKNLLLYLEAHHDIAHEEETEQYIPFIVEWINQRL